jgi:hypothetical protein
MKKLITIFAILLFAAPAFAADWSFYSSLRFGTWYVDRDYGGTTVNGQDDDQATQWFVQSNSRFGAKVKADKVLGVIELALAGGAGNLGGDGADANVQTRLAYGQWNFADNAFLKVGKFVSPVTDPISNQVYDSDGDLWGNGNFYGRRPAGLTVGIGDFEIAFLTPSYGGDIGTTATGVYNPNTGLAVVSGDPDSYIPRVEANYTLKLGPGYIKPFAGFQYYTVDSTSNTALVNGSLDILSYVLGVSTSWNIGALSLGGQLSYGANQGNVTGWSDYG